MIGTRTMPRPSSNIVHSSHSSAPLQYVSFIEMCCLPEILIPKISNVKKKKEKREWLPIVNLTLKIDF